MQGDRIATIDTVRGFAVLGILVMNIMGMAHAGAAYLNPEYTGGADDPVNLALWAVAAVAVDGKMRALFAMLFGASLLLMAEGNPPEKQTSRHLARMAVLFLFGLVHGLLLWPGDILLPFALVGLAVWPLRNQPAGRLFLFGILALTLQAAIQFAFALQGIAAQAAASLPNATPEAIEAWNNLRSATWTSPDDLARETAAYRGSLADILAIRAEANLFMRLFLLPFVFFGETFGLMLVGMALYRRGWWQGTFNSTHHARVAKIAIPFGLAIGTAIAWRMISTDFSAINFYATEVVRTFSAPLLALGYAAVIILIVKSGALPRLTARLAACGRMALTNYLMASILANLLFTGIGLGLHSSLTRAETLGVVLAIWALQLAWSKPWLEHFRYGPFEWLWRSTARWQRQPMQPPALMA
jgi:uncharacterized protein